MHHQPGSLARRFPAATAVLVLTGLGAAASATAQTLLWAEEFDAGAVPDPRTWSYDLGGGGWGNSELQVYTDKPENARIDNGHLVITATEVPAKGRRRKFESARIRTQDKLTVRYGVIEARIMVPDLADGLWPAFWTLGNRFSSVGWPAAGEIDIMEMGSSGAIADGVVNRRVGSTAHWEYQGGYAGYGLTYDAPQPLNGSWHVLRMEWDPYYIRTYLDNTLIWEFYIEDPARFGGEEFHAPHFLILNLAIGGSYTGIYGANDITAALPAEYRVDWIRVFDNGWTELGGSSLNQPPTGTLAHVAAIETSLSGRGRKQKARAVITIVDETGAPVADASVQATFSGGYNETLSATTDGAGVVSLVSNSGDGSGSFTVCVDDIAHAALAYDPAANAATCASF